jgi:hypothetical protein
MISVPVRYKRQQRAQLAQKIQHAAPAVVLLGDGFARVFGEGHLESIVMGAAEIGASALVIVALGRAIRGVRRARTLPDQAPHAHAIDWVDVCLAAVLAVEAFMHQHETGHLPRPTVLLAGVMLTLGLLHGKLAAHFDKERALRVTDEGISVPGPRFRRRLTLPWADVASIEITERSARIVSFKGEERRINLADAVQPEPIREALREAEARRAAAVVVLSAGE